MREQLFWNLGGRRVPVPYVAAWSSESEYFIAADKNAEGREAVFTHGERGVGTPVWGKMNEVRQRETVWLRRCQVCNCKLKDERSFAMDVQILFREGREVHQALTEPPACLACTRFALNHCPGNRRIEKKGELRCYEVERYEVVAQIVMRSDGEKANVALNAILTEPAQTAVGYHRMLLTKYEQITPEELRKRVAA